MMKRTRDLLITRHLLIYLLLGLVPLVTPVDYVVTYFLYILLYGMLAIGLCLLMAYAGQISVGHAAFFGIGAYVSGLLSIHYHIPFWAALPAAGVAAGVVGYLVGFPALRIKGLYLAVMTFAFGELVYVLMRGLDTWTGGPNGLIGIPRAELAGYTFPTVQAYYYLTLGVFVLVFVLAQNLVNSRVGRALRALHGSEHGATALGIDVNRY
ncbi:MAG: branched-chain amino acid ABC transporter permease, partial [Chloroflexota bacterium]